MKEEILKESILLFIVTDFVEKHPNVCRKWYLQSLEEYYFVPLDIFFTIKHNKYENTIDDDLEAWLYFLASDDPEDILNVINSKPRFIELYQDICEFRQHPEVAIMMFSEALRRLDENTAQYMIDEQKKEIERQRMQLEEKDAQLEVEKAENERLKRLLAANGIVDTLEN